jgi:starvation-inducible DNA-binding protein
MTMATMTRTPIVERLGVDLASALDLASQLKEAHWAVTGPNFIALHELFDRQAAEVRGHADALAERMRQLGGTPRGTIRQAAERSELDDFPAIHDEHEVVSTLVERYSTFCDALQTSASAAAEEGDVATEDLFIEVLRAANLQRWFLESHLKGRSH